MIWNIEPWHWFILGCILIVLEIFIPSFTIFWFGLAALVLSLFILIVPTIALPVQILIWIVLSITIMLLWFKFIKPLFKDKTQAGLSREATLGQVGMVIHCLTDHHEIIVRFPMPLLGSDEWSCRCISPIQVGERVLVTDILGNQLLVVPHSSANKNN